MDFSTVIAYPFFRNALAAVIIISIASAMIGTYIVSRRLVAISGGITHSCFGGLGLGYYLGVSPVMTAAVFAVAASLGVEVMSSRMKIREDSAIAVVWAIGMAVGVIFVFATPGYVPELNSFLFGNILTVTPTDLWASGIFTAALFLLFLCRYRIIVAIAFDRDFARVSGLPVTPISIIMTVMVAVCIVLTIRLVGIMLLVSMLCLPQLVAEVYSHRFKTIMFLSMGISLVGSVAGLFTSVIVDIPCSALIVANFALMYIISKIIMVCRH